MWFEKLTGFREESPEQVRRNIELKENKLLSRINGQELTFGRLEVPTLAELKQKCPNLNGYHSEIFVEEVVANVQELHCNEAYAKALFQAASQFNLLEMISPHVTPEHGIDRYEADYTQGPACAIACGAGTVYRNYFVPVNGEIGQTETNQIDCLNLIGKALDNENGSLWTMKNGYVLMNTNQLISVNGKITQLSSEQREDLKGLLKTGIQWNTEVTKSSSKHLVSQIYCSALPVAYNRIERSLWEAFSRIVLEATYESTLYAALINRMENQSNKVFLTLVGGGAFGNEEGWILESLQQALRKFRNAPLDVKIVSHRNSNPNLLKCISDIHSK